MEFFLSLLLVLIFFLVVCSAGLSISRLVFANCPGFHEFSADIRLLSSFLIGTLCFQFVLWLVGAWAITPLSQCVVLIAFGTVGVFSYRPFKESFIDIWRHGWMRTRSERALFVLAFLWLVLLIVLVVSANAPPSDGDSLNYHLRLIRRDIELGHFAPDPGISSYYFYPRLVERLGALFYVLGGVSAAQFVGPIYLTMTCVALWRLGRLLGLSPIAIVLGIFIFSTIRTVVFQTPTLHNDLALTFGTVILVISMIQIRNSSGPIWYWVAALSLAYAINVKYTGLQIAFVAALVGLLFNFKRYVSLRGIAAGLLVLLLILPLCWHNFIFTGNPTFPIFDFYFNPGENSFHLKSLSIYGRGKSFFNFLTGPFDIFLFPNRYFDGHQWGAPLVLILLPVGIVATWRRTHTRFLLMFIVVFYAVWFFGVMQQVRFLTPIMPILALLCGAGMIWLSDKLPVGPRRHIVMATACLLFMNQSIFVGGESFKRVQAGLGLVSKETFLSKLDNVHYRSCQFLSQSLQPGEMYLSNFGLDFYCPQSARLNHSGGSLNNRQLRTLIVQNNVKYIAVETGSVQKIRSSDASAYAINADNPLKFLGLDKSSAAKIIDESKQALIKENMAFVISANQLLNLLDRQDGTQQQ